MDECKPLLGGKMRDFGHALADEEVAHSHRDGRMALETAERVKQEGGRGLHSSTSQLNLSALCGIGDVRKGLCSPCSGGVRGCSGCFCVSDTAQVELKSERV